MNPFSITKEYKNGFETYILRNEIKKWAIDIIPALGARVNSFEIDLNNKSHSIIKGFHTDIKNKSVAGYYGAHLFPFPNRIKDGSYSCNGKKYELPITEINRNHALHGLIHNQIFSPTSESVNKNSASVSLQYTSDKKLTGFPFAFLFQVTYTLNSAGLHIAVTVENRDKISFPVGYGWHPYIDLGTSINALEISLASSYYLELDERLIPTGELLSLATPLDKYTLGESAFDNCFALEGNKDVYETLLVNPLNQLKIALYQKNELQYVQLFTPDTRDCIAIEPVSCIPNAFNTHSKGLALNIGERRTWECGIEVSS